MTVNSYITSKYPYANVRDREIIERELLSRGYSVTDTVSLADEKFIETWNGVQKDFEAMKADGLWK